MTTTNMNMTYHCKIQRRNRVQHIIDDIGLGQIVREKYIRTQAQIANNEQGTYTCITDTGITLIKTEDKKTVITMYVTTYRELVAIFGGERNIPKYLHKRVDRNQSYYTKNGKTIWR